MSNQCYLYNPEDNDQVSLIKKLSEHAKPGACIPVTWNELQAMNTLKVVPISDRDLLSAIQELTNSVKELISKINNPLIITNPTEVSHDLTKVHQGSH